MRVTRKMFRASARLPLGCTVYLIILVIMHGFYLLDDLIVPTVQLAAGT